MDVTFSDEQRHLAEVVRDFLDKHRDHPDPHRGEPDRAGFDTAAWKRMAGELGLTGLTVPERHGGAGASGVELGIVLSELGRAMVPVPYLSTGVAATVLAEAGGAVADEVLPGIADGSTVSGLAVTGPPDALPTGRRDGAGVRVTGTLRHVVDGPLLDVVLAAVRIDGDGDGDPTLVAIRLPGDGAVVEELPTLDRTRPQAHVAVTGAPAVPLGGAEAVERATDLLLTAVAVESAGAARYCLDATVAYLKDRVQFDRPIATFQALQHRCADMAVAVESAASTAWYAAWAAGADPAGLRIAGPLAKAYAADAFRTVAGEMIQLHGGIGFTAEHPAHRYFKRATSTEMLFGGRAWVRERVARRAGLRP